MGFFSSLLSTVAPLITSFVGGTAANIATPQLAAPVAQPLIAAPATQAVVPSPGIVSSLISAVNPFAAVAPLANIAVQQAQQAGATLSAQGGVGQANIFTRTIVQRVSRLSQNVLSQKVLRGSPFLMNSEVRSLRRVTKMINKAHGKIPRKTAVCSEDRIDDAVSKRLQQLNAAQCLVNGNGKC